MKEYLLGLSKIEDLIKELYKAISFNKADETSSILKNPD